MTDAQKQKVREELREKVRELNNSDYKNEEVVTFGYRHIDDEKWIHTVPDWGNIESYLIQKLEEQERELVGKAYKKGKSFAYHTCDCDYCHKKNLEVLSSLKQDENNRS